MGNAIEDNKTLLEQINKKSEELEKNNKVLEEIEMQQEKEEMLSEFILDPGEIYSQQHFHFIRICPNVMGIGRLMHRWADDVVKGIVIGRTQKLEPAIITSDHRLLPYNKILERKFKIQIKDIPSAQEERWALLDVQKYIREKEDCDIDTTFELIEKQYLKYISMPEIWAKIHALWDMATYFYPLTKVFPIFELRGFPGTGKNKAMAISSSISFNATQIMTNPSEATLFREMHKTRYIDEAEKIFVVKKDKIESDSRAEVINSGYRYDGKVPRQEKINNKFQTIWYDTFAPQMIASINGLYGATENRAIIRITTKPKPQEQQKSNIEPEPCSKEFSDIRNGLYLCLMQKWVSFELLYNQPSNRTRLKDREYWLWKPLLVIAELIDPELYIEILDFAEKQQDTKNSDYIPQESNNYKILAICYKMIEAGYDRMYVQAVRAELPQNDYTPAEKTISNQLDKLGFRDYRRHDRNGSYFQMPREVFESVVMPIAPNILLESKTNSSQSSQSSLKEELIDEERKESVVMNGYECDENKIKDVTNVTKNDELTNIFDGRLAKECPIADLLQRYTQAQIEKLKLEGRIYETKPGWYRLR